MKARTTTGDPTAKLRAVLPEYKPISEAPRTFTSDAHEAADRDVRYKSIDSEGVVWLVDNPHSRLAWKDTKGRGWVRTAEPRNMGHWSDLPKATPTTYAPDPRYAPANEDEQISF